MALENLLVLSEVNEARNIASSFMIYVCNKIMH